MEDEVFESFYEQTAQRLWAYVARISGNPSATDDIVQDAYIRFLLAARRPADTGQAKQYLYRIATNLVYDRYKILSRRGETEMTEIDHPVGSNFAGELEMTEVFSRLKTQERILLWLAYVEGHDHDAIARIAGVNKLSVKVLLFRARRKLAALVKGEQE